MDQKDRKKENDKANNFVDFIEEQNMLINILKDPKTPEAIEKILKELIDKYFAREYFIIIAEFMEHMRDLSVSLNPSAIASITWKDKIKDTINQLIQESPEDLKPIFHDLKTIVKEHYDMV